MPKGAEGLDYSNMTYVHKEAKGAKLYLLKKNSYPKFFFPCLKAKLPFT